MCAACEEGYRDKATHECEDCRNKMCSRCSRLHGMFAQGHGVRPLDARAVEISTSQVVKPKECPSHPSQPICFHCRQCDVSICLHCKLTSHEGHATEDIMSAVTRAKGELSRLIVTTNDQIHVLEAVLGALERDSLEISRQKQEMKSSVMSRCEALVSWATRARDEALEEMECVERAALNEIEAERVVAHGTKQVLSHLVARASLSCQTDADPNIVLHKSELQAALLNDDTVACYRKRGSMEGHATFFVGWLVRLEGKCFHLAVISHWTTFFTCRSDRKAVQLDQVRDFVGRQEGQEQTEKGKMDVMSVRELRERAVEMDKSLDDLKRSVMTLTANNPTGVLYRVGRSTQVAVTSGLPVVFDKSNFNEGDCYNNTTGVFTAPVNGTYVFLANLQFNTASGNCYISLSVDGNVVNQTNVVNNMSLIHDMLHIKAGQRVSLVPNFSSTLHQNGQYTYHTGALLCADTNN